MRERELITEVEASLSEQEDRYQTIFQATSDGLIISDPTRGVVVEANPAVCATHGYAYDEFIGLHGTAFIHSDYHTVFLDFIETIVAGGTYQTQALDLRKDGTAFHVEVHGSGVMYNGRPHILAVIRDVSERVQAKELLELQVAERTRELSTLLDVSHAVASTLELRPLLGLILEQLGVVAEYKEAAIVEWKDDLLGAIGYRGPLPEDAFSYWKYTDWSTCSSARPRLSIHATV